MTAPERPELHRARQWSVALETTLIETTEHVADVARRLSHSWPDDRGGEWTDRLLLLRRALERDAEAAAEVGRMVDRVADTVASAADASYSATSGPRLGSTESRRADDVRGARIPRLDSADDAG